jgi:hypothetical protein
MVSDFFTILTLIWSFAKHTLVSDHAHSKVINCDAMILATHYFRCHVARCA